MFFTGRLADKFNLRHFLTIGMILSGLSTAAFGIGYYANIHVFSYYVITQAVAGLFHATGWPAVVSCMGNWLDKGRRGLFMGVWNSHTSLGNIIGSILAGAFVSTAWGLSFIVPGLLMCISALLTFLFLIPYPEEVNLPRLGQSSSAVEVTLPESSRTEQHHSESIHEDEQPLIQRNNKTESVSFWTALRVPGVIEYSLSLMFSKLVSYSFLFWLPSYIAQNGGFDASIAADLSGVFDLGGIIGAIIAGYATDKAAVSGLTCFIMLILSIPALLLFYMYGVATYTLCIVLLIPAGILVNGPYGLITTVVATDLASHPDIRSNVRSMASIAGIIDGTGSIGAAIGPFLCGVVHPYGWLYVFMLLMISLAISALLLIRRVRTEIFDLRDNWRRTSHHHHSPITNLDDDGNGDRHC